MPIQSGDVKLLKSAIMADVPEGGGAPTGNAIPDGVSNAIFPDISELDRAGGRVNLRKTFVSIQTDDTDLYFGGNVIVAEPPEDPRVSVTLFSTESTFDTRSQAASRVESYLNKGPEWAGYLFENHIAGQRVIQLFQRPTAELPEVGKTLVLIENEGLVNQKEQYIRATAVTSSIRMFFDPASGKDYEAAVVSISISDALRTDFTGSPPARSFARSANTKVRDTVVADAGTYVGVVPLVDAATLGDFTIEASSVYTQLVPSAQTETPITDVRTNGLSSALTPTGGPLTVSLTLTWTTTQNLFAGGPILPGSLSVVRSGVTVTDSGGVLVSAGAQVGTVDYDNGILTLSTNLYGTGSGTHGITFTPAALPDMISQQSAIRITPASRSLSYTFVLDNPPLPGTLSISYLAQGRWYVLRDSGNGVLRGTESAFGTGTLNLTTGSVVVTLGALPDVGSSLVIQSFLEVTTPKFSSAQFLYGDRLYAPLNTSGQVSEEKGARSIGINGLTVTWTQGGATRTATDNGLGALTGDAVGSVDYSAGVVRLSPNILPPAGTVFLMDIDGATPTTGPLTLPVGNLGVTNITPGSVTFPFNATINYSVTGVWSVDFSSRSVTLLAYDRGGNLFFRDPGNGGERNLGTINYATGAISISVSPSVLHTDNGGPIATSPTSTAFSGFKTSWNGANLVGARTLTVNSISTTASYDTAGATPDSISITVNSYRVRAVPIPNFVLRAVNFTLAGSRYIQLTDDSLTRDPSPTTGMGALSGSVAGATGVVTVQAWPANANPQLTDVRGVLAPPTVGVEAPFTAFSTTFRTAAAPLRPGSFSVLGTMQDGTTFNVTAGTDGKINGTRVKGIVDYEYGLVNLYFVNPAGNPALNVDLSGLDIGGVTSVPADLVQLQSLRYNAVSYSYLPLDADLLGIDPVRLPSDGRVPIFRPGGFAVVGHTGEITATVSNGQTINCGRVRLSRVRVVGSNGAVINTGFTADLEAGTVTFTNVTGYSQPVTVQHRIEDMLLVREVDISGTLSFTRALTHNYPVPGSYVSSALVAGDLFARTSLVFDQASWGGTFSDTPGAAATATFNSAQYPIAVTNRGAITERWVVRFTNSSSFEVIGENVGVIATGNTATDCAPVNPATGVPYFTLPALGWGAGWATGNVLRINTIGAMFPVWVVRTVQQGPETVPDDSFTLLVRGDVDTP